jgi:hypothetical protein
MTDEQWMDRVRTCASELDSLEVSVGVTGDEAQAILRREGCGRRRELVFAAVALRRGEPVSRSASSASADMRRLERRRTRLADELEAVELEIEATYMR